MWGQDINGNRPEIFIGIIPTRVGTSSLRLASLRLRWDHPHACGDKVSVALPSVSAVGSSPRVWGQVVVSNLNIKNCGIIPTRVGTRILQRCQGRRERDHPHACGDKTIRYISALFPAGSSPRVWGQVLPKQIKGGTLRIIPTRVGTSSYIYGRFRNDRDHPHACGDKKSVRFCRGKL